MTRSTHLSFFNGKRVLITGGAGMLGSSIARRLVQLGAQVTLLDAMLSRYGGNHFNLSEIQEQVRFVEGDIRDAALMRRTVEGMELIFNLAAQVSYTDSNIEPIDDLDVNCRGQIHLLEAARVAGTQPKLVFASSRFVYGRIERNPVDEHHPLNCLSIYGIHKLTGEKYHRFYFERYGIPTVSLRIANPYGPRQQMKHNKYGIVNWFVRLALEGKPLTIYGDGLQKRDYVYIEDVVDAFLSAAACDQANGQVYNIGSGIGICFRDMAEQIVRAVPGAQATHTAWEPSRYYVETGDYISDITKIQRDTGWCPKVSMPEGIQATLDFYRRYKNHYWSSEEAVVPS